MKNEAEIWYNVFLEIRNEHCPICGGKSIPKITLSDDNKKYWFKTDSYCEEHHSFYHDLRIKIDKLFDEFSKK